MVIRLIPLFYYSQREVSSRLESYVVNLLDPNVKSDSYKMELELKYGFCNLKDTIT